MSIQELERAKVLRVVGREFELDDGSVRASICAKLKILLAANLPKKSPELFANQSHEKLVVCQPKIDGLGQAGEAGEAGEAGGKEIFLGAVNRQT